MAALTDKELLELAAKAAGFNNGNDAVWFKWSEQWQAFHTRYEGIWNPLADDGDALRLAVDLQMETTINLGENSNHAWARPATLNTGSSMIDKCRYAAARRAIVSAAAELGRSMP